MAKAPVSVDELVALVKTAIRNGTTHALPDLVGEWAHEAVKEVVRLHNELQAATETERKRCADIARKHAENVDEWCREPPGDGWDIADEIEKGVTDGC